jgi:hypothetical protein
VRLVVPSALWSGEVTCDRFTSPVFAALSGFFNLSALSSSPHLPSLVSCRSRSWDSTFRAFPSLESGAPRRRPLPSCRCPGASSRVTAVARSSRYLASRPSSGVFPSSESVHTGPGVSPNDAVDALLGLLPSKGLPRHRIAPISRGLLPRSCLVISTGLATRFDGRSEPRSVFPVPSGLSP